MASWVNYSMVEVSHLASELAKFYPPNMPSIIICFRISPCDEAAFEVASHVK